MKPSERHPSHPPREAHPVLFDLPLEASEPDPPSSRRQRVSKPAAAEQPARILPLFDVGARQARSETPRPRPVEPVAPLEPALELDERDATVGRRLVAGIADLSILALWTSLVGVAAAALLDGAIRSAALPLLGFGVLFSLVYTVLPLALWRRTAGMAMVGLACAGPGRGAVSLTQGVLRWLGAFATVAGLGLPAALLWTGRSLGDRLSTSHVESLSASS